MSNNEDDNKIVNFANYKKKKDVENQRNNIIVCVVILIIMLLLIGGGLYMRNKINNNSDNEETPQNTATSPDAEQEVNDRYSWWPERDVSEGGAIATSATAASEASGTYEIGSRFLFGTYSQGENGEITDIAWLVLDKDDDYALLVSEYVLDAKAYSTDGVIQWENSEIRAWLNDEFYAQAFSNSEKEKIACFEIENEDNQMYNTSGGHDTDDYVFLLSLEDVQDYLEVLTKQCKATPYAQEKGITVGRDNYATYWLRSPGSSDIIDDEPGYAATIDSNGSIKYYGNDSTYTNIGIRPAIWVKIGE